LYSERSPIAFDLLRFHLVGGVTCSNDITKVYEYSVSDLAVGDFSKTPSIISAEWSIAASSTQVTLSIKFDTSVFFPDIPSQVYESSYIAKSWLDSLLMIEEGYSLGTNYYGYMTSGNSTLVLKLNDLPSSSTIWADPNSVKVRMIGAVTNWGGTSRPVIQLVSPNVGGSLTMIPAISQIYALSSTGTFATNNATSKELANTIFDGLAVVFNYPLTISQSNRHMSSSVASVTTTPFIGSDFRLIWINPSVLWIDFYGVKTFWMAKPTTVFVKLDMSVEAMSSTPSVKLNSINSTGIVPIAMNTNPDCKTLIQSNSIVY
jgi:hypothetical protein